METIAQSIATWLISQGWPGIFITLLLAGLGLFWLEMKAGWRRNELLQDLRVEDAKKITAETVESIQSVRAAVAALGDLIRDRQGRR